jgi:TolB protein
VSRIVCLSPEGELFTIAPQDGLRAQPLAPRPPAAASGEAGAGPRRLDLDTSYAWPTWSPDGSRVAASRLQVTGQQVEVSVQVMDAVLPPKNQARTVYVNDSPGLVAEGAPHYLYWSPDGRALAMLVAGAQGLALRVQDLVLPPKEGAPPPATTIAEGAPLFCHWHPEGRALLVHHGEDVTLVSRPFDGGASSRQLMAAGSGFRTAAFSPQGRHLAYVVEAVPWAGGIPANPRVDAPGGGHLMVAELVSRPDRVGAAHRVLEVGPRAAFLWSPDGRELAVADHEQDPGTPAFGRLRVVPAEGGPAHTVAEETLLAFFWSPDGRRIAWVVLDLAEQRFQWKACIVQPPHPAPSASPAAFFSFQPAAQLFNMLQFFDQYAYSHALWSPDSSRLVVAGTREQVAARRNGHTPTGDRVWLLDPSGASPPVDLAAGTLAFWSWR